MLCIFPVHGKNCPDGPKLGQEFFSTNPTLADILGDADFDLQMLLVFWVLFDRTFPDFKVPDFQISGNLAWARLGPGVQLGPGLAGARLDWGPAWGQLGPAPLGLGSCYQDLGTKIFATTLWNQHLGTKILVRGSWYQDLGSKLLVTRFCSQDLNTQLLLSYQNAGGVT